MPTYDFVEVFNTLKRRELKYKKIFLVKLTAIEMKGYYDALKYILEWDRDTVIHILFDLVYKITFWRIFQILILATIRNIVLAYNL